MRKLTDSERDYIITYWFAEPLHNRHAMPDDFKQGILAGIDYQQAKLDKLISMLIEAEIIMLKLSLYGFEFYLIRSQYTVFYFDMKLPHNSIFTLDEAVKITERWIDSQGDWYQGVTSKQLRDKFNLLEIA